MNAHADPATRLPTLPTRSAVDLAHAIARGDLAPLELLEACISRMGAVNPGLNALCATDFERARAAARAAGEAVRRAEAPLPLLHGLPLGVKDLQSTAGLLSTFGNVGLRHHVPARDNALVARLRAAGAIVTAKTNVPDMGAGANTRNPVWGATGNPFNPMLNAGGSSGGSAAALATDLLPICTGSDTGGSLRIPAALCGVVGLRPSPGLVANDERALGWSVISVLGPMGRDVRDTALLMAASVGAHPADPLSRPGTPTAADFWPLPEVDLKGLRIGYTPDFGLALVDPGIRTRFAQRIEALRPWVAACEPWTPDLGEDADRVFDVLRAEAFVAAYGHTDPATLGPNVRANLQMAGAITLADRAWAHAQQTRIARSFAAAFERYDLLLAPVTPLSPFPWTELYATQIDGQATKNYYHWLALTYLVTLATNPALSLPCGRDAEGMPFGLQLIGPLYQDARLLAMARALEQRLEADAALARPRPDVAALCTPQPALRAIVTHPPGTGEPPAAAAGPGAPAVPV